MKIAAADADNRRLGSQRHFSIRVINGDEQSIVCFARGGRKNPSLRQVRRHLGRHQDRTAFHSVRSPLSRNYRNSRCVERRAAVMSIALISFALGLAATSGVDLHVAPCGRARNRLVVFRTPMADQDRPPAHPSRRRAFGVRAGSMLAHEIKNPLSRHSRRRANLLEASVAMRIALWHGLIADETDRIVSLVDRMEISPTQRPVDRHPSTFHSVLDHVKAGNSRVRARKINCRALYPSLPSVTPNRDQLVQVFSIWSRTRLIHRRRSRLAKFPDHSLFARE